MNDEYHVYVLLAKASTGRFTVHVGIAKDVQKRMGDHRAGKVKATRGRSISLLGSSKRMPHGDALRLEMMLKNKSRNDKVKWAMEQQDAAKSIAFWGTCD